MTPHQREKRLDEIDEQLERAMSDDEYEAMKEAEYRYYFEEAFDGTEADSRPLPRQAVST